MVASATRGAAGILSLAEPGRGPNPSNYGDREQRTAKDGPVSSGLPSFTYRRLLTRDGQLSHDVLGDGYGTLTGYAVDSALPFESLVHPADHAAFLSGLMRSTRAKTPVSLTYRLLDAGGGERWVRDVATYQGVTNGAVVWHGAVMDVDDLVRDGKAAVERMELAERSARQKSVFLAAMSHEIRTPLNAILGFSQILQDTLSTAPGFGMEAEYTEHVLESGYHLLDLINEILDLSAIEAGKVSLSETEFDVHFAIEAVLTLLRPRAEKNRIHLQNFTEPGRVHVRADPTRLKQVLLNLLSNAVKFTGEGDSVTVDAFVALTGDLVLVVADTGVGMAPEDVPRALRPYEQVGTDMARRGEGTGLGLTMVQKLVDLHGGRFDLESRRGLGTTARLRLPAARVVVH